MPRFMIELSGSTDFLKNMVANPVDRVSELTPVLQDMGITFEQRYYVVGENKAYDIISGDSDAVQALLLAGLSSGAVASATCREITTSAETVPIFQQAKESSFKPTSSSYALAQETTVSVGLNGGSKVTESLTTSRAYDHF